MERALEHDRPTLFCQLACDTLRREQIVRPGLPRLERLVAPAREQAHAATFRRLTPLLTPAQQAWLDSLLLLESDLGRTRLAGLRQEAVSHAASQILMTLERMQFLGQAGVPGWALTDLTPNRVQWLAPVGWRATPQQFQRMPAVRRYPMLLAVVQQALHHPTDIVVELADQCLWASYTDARQELEECRKTSARATHDTLVLFQTLSKVLLDTAVDDTAVREVRFARVPEAT